MKKFNKTICALGTVALTVLLSGCKYDLLNPAGYVAEQERTLIFICVGVMLCVVIPVMIAVVLFAIKYRASRESEQYLPDSLCIFCSAIEIQAVQRGAESYDQQTLLDPLGWNLHCSFLKG